MTTSVLTTNKTSSLVQKYPIPILFLLVLGLTWPFMIVDVLGSYDIVPFRVPIARFAAAQAGILDEKAKAAAKPAKKAAPKAAAKPAPVKKAVAKAAPVKKAVAPAKKAAPKAAPAKKVVAKPAPVKKAAPAKASVKAKVQSNVAARKVAKKSGR